VAVIQICASAAQGGSRTTAVIAGCLVVGAAVIVSLVLAVTILKVRGKRQMEEGSLRPRSREQQDSQGAASGSVKRPQMESLV
uniref:Uncharacterized protein n=1 Tax=Scleropages formosus TaxID=113540 RepID=A0A8C9R1T6_SCLFO